MSVDKIVIDRAAGQWERPWRVDCMACWWRWRSASHALAIEAAVDHASDRHGVSL